jgi:hypothetical protein
MQRNRLFNGAAFRLLNRLGMRVLVQLSRDNPAFETTIA